MSTVADAIAESTRTKPLVRVVVTEPAAVVAEAEGAAVVAGLEFYPIPTPEGFDVYACAEGEPETWKLEIAAERSGV